MLKPTVVQVKAIYAYQIQVLFNNGEIRISVRMSCMTSESRYHKTDQYQI